MTLMRTYCTKIACFFSLSKKITNEKQEMGTVVVKQCMHSHHLEKCRKERGEAR